MRQSLLLIIAFCFLLTFIKCNDEVPVEQNEKNIPTLECDDPTTIASTSNIEIDTTTSSPTSPSTTQPSSTFEFRSYTSKTTPVLDQSFVFLQSMKNKQFRQNSGSQNSIPIEDRDLAIESLLQKNWTQLFDFSKNVPSLIWLKTGLPQLKGNSRALMDLWRSLGQNQVINRIPFAAENLNQKNGIVKNFRRMQTMFGKEEFRFHPESFIIPEEEDQLVTTATQKPDARFLSKPAFGGMGSGIYLFTAQQIVNKMYTCLSLSDGGCVVQEYVSNPLLWNGFKHTVRVYVLATSFGFPRLYISSYGIVKIAMTSFNLSNFSNQQKIAHVTNQDPSTSGQDKRTTLPEWFEWISNTFGSDKSELVKQRITDSVLKYMLMGEHMIAPMEQRFCGANFSNLQTETQFTHCFQMFGVDLELTDDFHPIIFEANVNPGLHTSLESEREEKIEMMTDLFRMVGLIPPAPQTTPISQDTQLKVSTVYRFLKDNDTKSLYRQFSMEMQNRGSWQLLFPHSSTVTTYKTYVQHNFSSQMMVWARAKILEDLPSTPNFPTRVTNWV